MLDWLNILLWYEKLLWFISIVFTLIFLFQFFITAIQRTPGKKRNSIFSRFFSFKNITAFLSMFGWVSISCIYQNIPLAISLFIGIVGGITLMGIMSVLFYFTQKLKENQRPEAYQSFDNTGKVVLKVGSNRSQIGKIKVKIDGKQKVMKAMTDFDHDLEKDTEIRVDSVNENGIFIIKPTQ